MVLANKDYWERVWKFANRLRARLLERARYRDLSAFAVDRGIKKPGDTGQKPAWTRFA